MNPSAPVSSVQILQKGSPFNRVLLRFTQAKYCIVVVRRIHNRRLDRTLHVNLDTGVRSRQMKVKMANLACLTRFAVSIDRQVSTISAEETLQKEEDDDETFYPAKRTRKLSRL